MCNLVCKSPSLHRLSGITEESLRNITTSIRDVQAIMLNLFSADTILIGHSLENDLIALKVSCAKQTLV